MNYTPDSDPRAPAEHWEEEAAPPRRRGWARILFYTGLTAAVLAVAGMLVVVGYIWSVTRELPSVEALQNYAPPVTTRVYAGDGTLLGEYARERRIFVPIAFVPKLVVSAFTSAEDRNFFNHPGIDPGGILRAAVKDVFNVIQHKRLEGASTITQQVAKNFLLNSDVKFSRKIREAVLAVRIDATYSKEKILELYLNEIYLGENSYGVAAAALNYIDKSLDQMDVAEVAFLAALPKAPSNYDPVRNARGATERRNWVISQMADNGYITDAQAQGRDRRTSCHARHGPWEVRRRTLTTMSKKFGAFFTGNMALTVSMMAACRCAPHWTRACKNFAVSALRTGLVRYDRRHGWRGAASNIRRHDQLEGRAGIVAEPIRHRHLACRDGARFQRRQVCAHRSRWWRGGDNTLQRTRLGAQADARHVPGPRCHEAAGRPQAGRHHLRRSNGQQR